MTPPPLVLVRASLGRAAPRLAALPHVADLVSNLMDASLVLPLAHAAASGSVPLFQRVAARLLAGARADPIIRADAFALALEAAIRANDLAMAAALHALHPQPLDARSLKLAMAHGSLALVQWVVGHRHDRVCCAPGVANLCRGCAELAAQLIGAKDPFAIASWLIDAGVLSVSDGADTTTCSTSARTAMLKSVELVRWCDARGLLSDPMIDRLMRDTMHEPNEQSEAIVRYFLERGFAPCPEHEEVFVDALIAASCHPGQEALVQLVLDSQVFHKPRQHFVYAPIRAGGAHVLQWDDAYQATTGFMFMATVVSIVGKAGHLSTMQWLVEARNTTMLAPQGDHANERELLAILVWLHSNGIGRWSGELMDGAAASGHLQAVQWLHQNRSEPCSTRAMDGAAANGHLEIVRWLHDNRSEGCTEHAMNAAAGGGNLAVVAWLHENRTEGNVSTAAAFATANGQLDMMRWCLDHGGCARCVHARLLEEPLTYTITQFASLDIRVLSSLAWLDAHAHSASAVDCRGQCVATVSQNTFVNLAAAALGQGDMLLLSYLHEHHRELFAWPAHHLGEVMNAITWQGHLPAVQWLHARYPDNLDWLLLAEDASQRDQIEVAEWLRTVARTE